MIDKQYTDKLTARLPEIESKLSDPAVAANQKKYQELVREHSTLKKLQGKADVYFRLKKDLEEHKELTANNKADPELAELAGSEIEKLEKDVLAAEKDLMVALLPPDPDVNRNAIMEIRAGTGGNEAALFAGDLFRMYCRYAEENGWKTGLIDASPSEMGGYKEVIFSVEGQNIYGNLKFESGVHRVQRIPLTESSGRIHTSAATVAVLPEAEPHDDLQISPDELRIDICRASGAGGQHVNTTDSAVRITHLPSGLVAQSQDERSQHRNKEKAMGVLKARLLDCKRREEEQKRGDARRSQIGSGDRSERIRTYNFPQNRVTDHRINLTLYSLDRIIGGEIRELIEALQDHEIKQLLAEESKPDNSA
ncbi:peptide chain release factor 1 [Verrucomicrobiota bacterium]